MEIAEFCRSVESNQALTGNCPKYVNCCEGRAKKWHQDIALQSRGLGIPMESSACIAAGNLGKVSSSIKLPDACH